METKEIARRRARAEAIEKVLARHGINCRQEPCHMAHQLAQEIVDALFDNGGQSVER